MKIVSFEIIFLVVLGLVATGGVILGINDTNKAIEQCEKYGFALKETIPDGSIVCYEILQDELGFTYKNEIKMLKEWKNDKN